MRKDSIRSLRVRYLIEINSKFWVNMDPWLLSSFLTLTSVLSLVMSQAKWEKKKKKNAQRCYEPRGPPGLIAVLFWLPNSTHLVKNPHSKETQTLYLIVKLRIMKKVSICQCPRTFYVQGWLLLLLLSSTSVVSDSCDSIDGSPTGPVAGILQEKS